MEDLRVRQAQAYVGPSAHPGFNMQNELARIAGQLNSMQPNAIDPITVASLEGGDDETGMGASIQRDLDALALAIRTKTNEIDMAIYQGRDADAARLTQERDDLRTLHQNRTDWHAVGGTYTDTTMTGGYHHDESGVLDRRSRVTAHEARERTARSGRQGGILQYEIDNLRDVQSQLEASGRDDTREYRDNNQQIQELQDALTGVDRIIDNEITDARERLQSLQGRADDLRAAIHEANRTGSSDVTFDGQTISMNTAMDSWETTQAQVGEQEERTMDLVRNRYEESISAIERWTAVLMNSTQGYQEHAEALQRLTQAERTADQYYDEANDRAPGAQRELLGDAGAQRQYDDINRMMDEALEQRTQAYSDVLRQGGGNVTAGQIRQRRDGVFGSGWFSGSSNQSRLNLSNEMPQEMRAAIATMNPRVQTAMMRRWSERIASTSQSVTGAANQRLQDLSRELEAISRQLLTASGRDRRQLINRRNRLVQEQQRQTQIISNAGVIDQVSQREPRTWLQTIGNTIQGGMDRSQYLLYGGMGGQAISSMFGNTYGTAISQGAMQAGIYSQMARTMAPGMGHVGMAFGLVHGAAQGGMSGWRDAHLQRRQDDAQRRLSESTEQLSRAFQRFKYTLNSNDLQRAWKSHADVVAINTRLELEGREGLSGYLMRQFGYGQAPETMGDAIAQGQWGSKVGSGANIGGYPGMMTGAYIGSRFGPRGTIIGGTIGYGVGNAVGAGIGHVLYGTAADQQQHNREMLAYAANQKQAAASIADQFQSEVERRITKLGHGIDDILSDPKLEEGLRASALVHARDLNHTKNLIDWEEKLKANRRAGIDVTQQEIIMKKCGSMQPKRGLDQLPTTLKP